MAKSAFYKVWNDKKVDITDMVTDLTVEESETESDMIKFKINDTRIQVMDADWLADGKKIYVLFGFIGGEISTKRTGKIHSVDYTYGAANSITVEALDMGNLYQTSNKVYKQKTITQTVQEIAKAAGLKFIGDPTTKKFSLLAQGNKTYMQFLQELAGLAGSEEKEGSYFCSVSGETIFFKKRNLAKKPVLKINRNDKISFTVDQNSSKTMESMSTSFIDPETNKVIKVDSNAATDQETALGNYLYNSNGDVLDKKSDSGRNVVLPYDSKEDAKKQLDAHVKDSQLEGITGTLTMEGTFSVKKGDIVTLVGFARKHSGNWKVDKVSYGFSPSFKVTLTMKKNASDVKGASVNSAAKDKNSKIGEDKGQEKTEVTTVKYNANGVKQ
jgi:phage protein D